MSWFNNDSWLGQFYGNGDSNTPPPSNDDDNKDDKGKKGGENTPKLFTQEEVNAMLAENKRNIRKELDDLKKQGDPVALQKKVKELQDSLLTKEELARQQAEELKTNFETQIKELGGKAESWEKLYRSKEVEVAIATGATKHDAYDADQLSLIIGPMTRVEEITDDKGVGTGKFKSITTVEIDGKKLELPTVDAIGKLREAGKYPNQFRVKGQSGTGVTLNNQPPAAQVSDGEVPKDMDAFMKTYGQKIKNAR